MKVISVNVNGIRAAANKGLYEWLANEDADVVCVQELKAQPEQIQGAPFYPQGVHTYLHAAEKKGYSGVALYCKREPDRVQYGLGDGFADMDSEGRYIQADFGDLSVVSLYLPSGSSKDERQVFKIELMARFESKLADMIASGRRWIICGDWNIAHKKRDIKNWRGNQKNSGFLPEERQWLDWLFGETEPETAQAIVTPITQSGDAGFRDAFRIVNDLDEQYTWWSNRGQAWANNTGWRIDYHVISANLATAVKPGSARIYTDERFSDHAPLVLEYDLAL